MILICRHHEAPNTHSVTIQRLLKTASCNPHSRKTQQRTQICTTFTVHACTVSTTHTYQTSFEDTYALNMAVDRKHKAPYVAIGSQFKQTIPAFLGDRVQISFGPQSTKSTTFNASYDVRKLTQYSKTAETQVDGFLNQHKDTLPTVSSANISTTGPAAPQASASQIAACNLDVPTPCTFTVHYATLGTSDMDRLSVFVVLKWLLNPNFTVNGFPLTYAGRPQITTAFVTELKDCRNVLSFEFFLHVQAAIRLVALKGPLGHQQEIRNHLVKYIGIPLKFCGIPLTLLELRKLFGLFHNTVVEDYELVQRAMNATVDHIDDAKYHDDQKQELEELFRSVPAIDARVQQIRVAKQRRLAVEERMARSRSQKTSEKKA
jgi:hypothetical protein